MNTKKIFTLIYIIGFLFGQESVNIPFFEQEKRAFFLEGKNVYSVATTKTKDIYVGTDSGLFIQLESEKDWNKLSLNNQPVVLLSAKGTKIVAITGELNDNILTNGMAYFIKNKVVSQAISLPKNIHLNVLETDLVFSNQLYLGGKTDLFVGKIKKNDKHLALKSMKTPSGNIRQITVQSEKNVFVATAQGLYKKTRTGWNTIQPHDDTRSWALADCRSVAMDSKNRLWFASPQGVGVLDKKEWILYEGKDGLPYNDFTKMAAGQNGDVWFGTTKGAIHFDGKTWEYRQGKRWLPDDHVNDIVVAKDGSVWIATSKGLSHIYKEKMTLAEKAKFYEDEIDKYHRRTPYEYVLDVNLPKAGDKSDWVQHDSDNDGLWTGMYGAAECFAYAATKDPKAKARAKKAFDALKFLGDVTQDAPISPPPGFVARTILPTSGHDPNIGRVENDIRKQKNNDTLWKVYENRWPKDKTGKWYYKTDTSSDELDGHYFLYGLYYDLVAETEDEKERVRAHIKKLTDHLIDHDFQLVDHDGKPTRWSRFNPYELNHDKNWFVERGLNSLSMLSYLSITHHITGDDRYRELSNMLIEDHGYAQNMTDQKFNRGVGTGNHSDDEMAFMSYYHLINYETDP
ncbi:MAG: hypothetical protein HOO16_06970, partial [Candidatus Marinimicrobia bacterium]|nr:hypothetical protein [Candidatus Neomarinimicrobiota bacterium]